MKHISEHKLELSILDPLKLSDSDRREIGKHLESCRSCSAIAAHFRGFYEELSTLESAGDPRTNAFVESLGRDAVIIPLKPMSPAMIASENSGDQMIVLAAETREDPTSRYKPVCVFYSQRDNLVVRILKDNKTLKYRLFLLMNEPLAGRKAAVAFPTLGIEVRTDERGRAEFAIPPATASFDWSATPAELRLLPND